MLFQHFFMSWQDENFELALEFLPLLLLLGNYRDLQ